MIREQLAQFAEAFLAFAQFVRRNPVQAILLGAVAGVIIYFFGFLRLFAGQGQAIWTWAWMRFLSQYNQEHSKVIPLIFLWLLWYHRKEIAAAPKKGSHLGLLFVVFGILCYIIGVRALQPRVSLFGFPFLVFGSVLYLWGRQVARILFFPCAILFFMIPLGAIEQMTFKLQFLITGLVTALSNLVGIGVYSVGTSIRPVAGEWNFDISGGCSGIRSLIAMVMITAVYVHLTQSQLWKKITILIFSVFFAIIGNAVRIFTIVVVARLGHAKFAGGFYHDWSDWIFFPVAVLSMLAFSKLLNLDFKKFVGPKGPDAKENVVYDY
jgi:exosortase